MKTVFLVLLGIAIFMGCSPERLHDKQFKNSDTIDSPPDTSNITPPDTLVRL